MNKSQEPSIDVLTLTKQLVSIPSYVDSEHDESELIDFIALFFDIHLPSLTVERQPISSDSKRSNLLVKGKSYPSLFVLGHVDTVQPTDSWSTDPLDPVVVDGKLYGLGAADMKGSLAAFLCALTKMPPERLDQVMALFYVDEEYNFLGTKRFLENQELSQKPPKLIVSLDGSLDLASGCRGLIEFNAKITGKSGHASNPSNGNNVIIGVAEAVKNLEGRIRQYDDTYLGESTLNLAYMQAGIVERQDNKVIWLREGNVIPDSADITLEVRTARKDFNSEVATKLFEQEINRQDLTLASLELRHDFGPWSVSYDTPLMAWFEACYAEAEIPFSISDRRLGGFIDVQMITEVVDSPTFVIGAGGSNKHGADENVEIENLTKVEKLYLLILSKYGDLK